jgi:hypothetical protein
MSSTPPNAGYSDRPLLAKLGYQPGDSILLTNAPDWLREMLLDASVTVTPTLPATWSHAFFTDHTALTSWLKSHDLSTVTTGLWFSWPKKSSGLPTTVTDQTFRDLLLPLGWVDTKVCAVDDTWSGLKFLRRRS